MEGIPSAWSLLFFIVTLVCIWVWWYWYHPLGHCFINQEGTQGPEKPRDPIINHQVIYSSSSILKERKSSSSTAAIKEQKQRTFIGSSLYASMVPNSTCIKILSPHNKWNGLGSDCMKFLSWIYYCKMFTHMACVSPFIFLLSDPWILWGRRVLNEGYSQTNLFCTNKTAICIHFGRG